MAWAEEPTRCSLACQSATRSSRSRRSELTECSLSMVMSHIERITSNRVNHSSSPKRVMQYSCVVAEAGVNIVSAVHHRTAGRQGSSWRLYREGNEGVVQ
jgi:hypothetical protein